MISLAVIVFFRVRRRDPVLNLFYWFSGLAVLAIVFVEILVSIAVIAFFSRHRGEVSIWARAVRTAPLDRWPHGRALAAGSRFALLAGTVADGVDPTRSPGASTPPAGSWYWPRS